MRNRYNYIGDEDFIDNNMYPHKKFMQEYNLSCAAIREFAIAIKRGDLDALRKEFALLSDQQRQGLLESYIDFESLWGIPDIFAPSGLPIEIARQFNHHHIIEFLIAEKEKLFSSTMTPLTKDEKGQHLFPKSPCGILPFFIKDKKIIWGCIKTNRVRIKAYHLPAGTQNIFVKKDAELFSIEVSKPLNVKKLDKDFLQPFIEKCDLLLKNTSLTEADKQRAKMNKMPILIYQDNQFSIYGYDGEWKETILNKLTVEESKYLEAVFLSNKDNPVIIKNKDIDEAILEIIKKGHFLGKSVSEENFQDIVNCFLKNKYKVYVEDMLTTAIQETKEEHGVDVSSHGTHRHLLVCLCEFAEQKILAKRGTTTQKVYTAYISDPSKIKLSNNSMKVEEKIKANLWREFYEKGIWCSLEEIKRKFESEKSKFDSNEHIGLNGDQQTVMAQELTAWGSRIELMETIEAHMSHYLIEKGLVINSDAKESLIPFNMIEKKAI